MLCPSPLHPGSVIRIIAPSSPFDHTLVRSGLGWLGRRYKLRFDQGLFARDGFLAGSDERRLRELDEALRDPDAAAIVAARGGYGATRIAHEALLAQLGERPRWIVGFSDVTALHLEAQNAGVMSLHAHNVAGLGRGDARAREAWCRALEQPGLPQRFGELDVYHPGHAEGPVFGGNLSVLFCAQAAGRLQLPAGAILFLEDVGESSYRIDRMLTALLTSGVMSRISGVLLGEFTDCTAGKYQVPCRTVLRERLASLGVPVLGELPIGHGRHNQPLTLGAWARLDSQRAEVIVEARQR